METFDGWIFTPNSEKTGVDILSVALTKTEDIFESPVETFKCEPFIVEEGAFYQVFIDLDEREERLIFLKKLKMIDFKLAIVSLEEEDSFMIDRICFEYFKKYDRYQSDKH